MYASTTLNKWNKWTHDCVFPITYLCINGIIFQWLNILSKWPKWCLEEKFMCYYMQLILDSKRILKTHIRRCEFEKLEYFAIFLICYDIRGQSTTRITNSGHESVAYSKVNDIGHKTNAE